MACTCVWLEVQRIDAYLLHQRRNTTSINSLPFAFKKSAQHSCTCEGGLKMQLVDSAHQR